MAVVFGVAIKITLTLIVKGGVTPQFRVMTRAPIGMPNTTMNVRTPKLHKYLTIVAIRQRITVIKIRMVLPVSSKIKRYFAEWLNL